MPKPYGEDSSNNQLSHWIDRAVQAEFRAEKFETALSKEVLAVIQKAAAQAAFEPKMIEATWVVSPDEAARLKARMEREAAQADVAEFKEYLKWTGNQADFAEWQEWRRQKSDGGPAKEGGSK